MPLLFSYGTLQQESVQLATFGRPLGGRADEVVGFEPSLVKIEDPALSKSLGKTHHANLTYNGREESRVAGTVFEITEAELAQADRYEAPARYVRISAILASGDRAWVYVDHRSARAPGR